MSESEFKHAFTVTFLASWAATNYADYCSRGLYEELHHPPVEDATGLADDAWAEMVKQGAARPTVVGGMEGTVR